MSRRKKKKPAWIIAPLLIVLSLLFFLEDDTLTPTPYDQTDYDHTSVFPVDRYPETASHIQTAVDNGHSAICTIDRDGADSNRRLSLSGIPTKDGFDRDEWPMAVCAEGGTGASIAYISPSDNRGAGSWVGNQISDYPDGTRVLFVIDGTVNPVSADVVQAVTDVYYENCTAAKEAGAAPLYEGDPGYRLELDRDRDGVACQ